MSLILAGDDKLRVLLQERLVGGKVYQCHGLQLPMTQVPIYPVDTFLQMYDSKNQHALPIRK